MGSEERVKTVNLVERITYLEHIVRALADRLGFVMTVIAETKVEKALLAGVPDKVTRITLEDRYREAVSAANAHSQVAGVGSGGDEATGASGDDRQASNFIIPA